MRNLPDHDQGARFWDREAAAFDDEPDHGLRDAETWRAWHDLFVSHLPAAHGRIADVGCGTGTISVLLAAAGHHVAGIDLSPQMLARARAKAASNRVAVELALGDAVRPPLRPHAFDAVVCRHVLWVADSIKDTLRTWAQLLRPNGVLLLEIGRASCRERV